MFCWEKFSGKFSKEFKFDESFMKRIREIYFREKEYTIATKFKILIRCGEL